MGRTTVNDTSAFYSGDAPSLFWEMTICQSLSDVDGPYMKAIENPAPYGAKVAKYLDGAIPLGEHPTILEIGGGYGSLMGEFTRHVTPFSLTMVDISERFLALQRRALAGKSYAGFVNADVFKWLAATTGSFDLVISNENIGDFATCFGLDAAELALRARKGPPFGKEPLELAARLVCKYELELPEAGEVAVNTGALELVEALAGRARAVFLSEHSATVKPAEVYDFLVPIADGRVRRIELKDHDEYSINFDHVQRVAEQVGFEVERIPMIELLGVRHDAGARFMAAAECVGNEVAEAVHEFLHHVKEYECALLTRRE